MSTTIKFTAADGSWRRYTPDASRRRSGEADADFVSRVGAQLARPGETWEISSLQIPASDGVFNPVAVKQECARRIAAVCSLACQLNMMANAAAMQDHDAAAYHMGLVWIGSMQLACRAMIGAHAAKFSDDVNWPSPPVEFVMLAKNY